jgi:hypothetical protein
VSGWWLLLLLIAILEKPRQVLWTMEGKPVPVLMVWPHIAWMVVCCTILFAGMVDAHGWP